MVQARRFGYAGRRRRRCPRSADDADGVGVDNPSRSMFDTLSHRRRTAREAHGR
jgi:hypothetical protein